MTTPNPADALAERLWFTRKAWICAEERLLKNEHHTQLLMVVYAAYTTSLSVILLAYEPDGNDKKLIDTSLAVLSIILLALSLYLNSKSFKDRAARFKSGYHDLHDIENKLRSLSAQPFTGGVPAEYITLSDRYNKVLRDVENHTELDDICNRIGAGSGLNSRLPTKAEFGRYYWWLLWRFFALGFFYLAPASALAWFFYR